MTDERKKARLGQKAVSQLTAASNKYMHVARPVRIVPCKLLKITSSNQVAEDTR